MATRKTTRRRTTTPGKKTTRRKTASTRSVSMTKKQKDNLIKVGAAVGVGYLLFRGTGKAMPLQKQASILPGSPGSGNYIPMDEPPPITAPGMSTAFPLGVGSSGNVVKSLQRALLKMGGTTAQYIRNTSMRSDGSVDGIFGQGTKNAVYAARIGYPVSYTALQNIL